MYHCNMLLNVKGEKILSQIYRNFITCKPKVRGVCYLITVIEYKSEDHMNVKRRNDQWFYGI